MKCYKKLVLLMFLSSSVSFSQEVQIRVKSHDGSSIPGAEAAIVQPSGIFLKGKSNGESITFEPFSGRVSLLLAAPGFRGESISFTSPGRSEFTLKSSVNRNSFIVYERGDIPGKNGDISPIHDKYNRLYMYYSGKISLLKGSKPADNPFTFRMKSPIKAIDGTGKKFKIYVVDIKNGVSVVEYTK